MATPHLAHLGHKRIAMVAGEFSFSDKSFHRWQGYCRALKEHGLTYDPDLVIQTRYTLNHGTQAVRQLLHSSNPPTAIFCSNDYLAIGAMQGATALNYSIPQDLSVVGYDDMPLAAYLIPPLTTVHQPAFRMGEVGTEHLLQRIAHPECAPLQRLLDIKLVERGSTATPNR